MPVTNFSETTFQYLEELELNNNRDWFMENKKRLEAEVRGPFADLLEKLSQMLPENGLDLHGGSKTMFRMNRDVRFSNDKSPYKTFVSGLLTKTGTKDISTGLVYIHLDARGGFVVSGLYQPPTERLYELRTSMIEQHSEFAATLSSLRNAGLELDPTDATKNMPRGFSDYSDHEHSESLKLKNIMVRRDLKPKEWWKTGFETELTDFAVASKPILEFLDRN
jgi:uncharacterized protein (TIGR02453 family)